MLLALAAAGLVLLPAASASHTPNPSSVTVAGSLQSELGCPGDWDPGCAATHMTYDANDGVWQLTGSLPAGSYAYKAALNNAWDENYGLHAAAGGADIPLNLPATASVKFYYDHKTHWVTDNKSSVIAVAPGSFQSELGCSGRLGSGLPPLVASGPGRQRDLLVRDDGDSARVVRVEGGDQRELGRELRPGRRAERLGHPVHGPVRQREGDLHLRRVIARAHDHALRSTRERCRISISPARTASAPPATRPRRSGTRSPTAS